MNDDARRIAAEHFERGIAFERDGYRDRAIAEWQKAVALDPDFSEAHYNLGIAYADQARNDLAISALREAARLAPFDTDARKALADIYSESEAWAEAENQLRQALHVAPGDSEAAHMLADLYLGQERWDEASGALEAGGMLEEDADLWFELGQAYEDTQRRDDAILAYRRALTAFSEHRDALHALQQLGVPYEAPADPDEPLDALTDQDDAE